MKILALRKISMTDALLLELSKSSPINSKEDKLPCGPHMSEETCKNLQIKNHSFHTNKQAEVGPRGCGSFHWTSCCRSNAKMGLRPVGPEAQWTHNLGQWSVGSA